MYICGRTLPYLFQFFYHMVFELEDLQHFPVSHLSFVLLTSKKKKNNKIRVSEPFSPAHNHLFYHNELLGETKTSCQLGTCLFQLLQATRGHPFPPLIIVPSTHPMSEASSHVSLPLLIIMLPWQTLK